MEGKKTSEAQKRAIKKYFKSTMANFKVWLNRNTDKDIIEFLSKSKNKTRFVKEAIREAIKKEENRA